MTINRNIVDKMTFFIFDKDFDITLFFDSWLKTKQEVAAFFADDHVMKSILNAILDYDAEFLFLINVFGLTDLLRVILKHVANLDINQKIKFDHTSVYFAAVFGYSITISIFVDHETIINIEFEKYGSSLHATCFAEHLKVVDNFFKFDASIFCDFVFDDVLQTACRNNCENVTFHFIESGFMVKFENDYDQVFENAARAGFVNVVKRFQRPFFLFFNKSKLDTTKKKTRKAIKGDQLGVVR